jgi:hypothetical protein
MRGWDAKSDALFSYVSCEARVPKDHPLRSIRPIVDGALAALSPEFEQLYAKFGRRRFPRETASCAAVAGFYSVYSELQLMEQLDYNLLFRWFGRGRMAFGGAAPSRRLHITNLARPPRADHRLLQPARHVRAVHQVKEGKNAIKWTRLSCRTFAANTVRLQCHALAYNLGNFMRTLAMPKAAEPKSLTSRREKLIRIGAKVVSHGRYVTSRWPTSRCHGRCSRKSYH